MQFNLREGMIVMWFWQRQEIYAGVSVDEFNRIRQTLRENGIDYDFHMSNQQRLNFDRGVMLGRWGTDHRFDTIYYIYVKKQDFNTAQHLLQNAK